MSLGTRYKGKFATLHPIYKGLYTNPTQNLTGWSGVVGQTNGLSISSIGKTYSKWYWEVSAPSQLSGQQYPSYGGTLDLFGIISGKPTYNNTNVFSYGGGFGISYSCGFRTNNSTNFLYGPSPWSGTIPYPVGSPLGCTGGDVFGLCMDLDNRNFYVFKNGVRIVATVSSIPSGTWYPGVASPGFAGTFSINFGATGFAYPSSIPAGFHPGVFDVKSSRLKVLNTGILSDDRLTYDTNSGTDYTVSIIGKKSGKWYWEVTPIDGSVSFVVGVVNSVLSDTWSGSPLTSPNSWIWQVWGTSFKRNGSTLIPYGTTIAVNDCIGVALDMDAGQITMYRNGATQGVMFTGLTGSMYPIASGYAPSSAGTTPKYTFNFGDTPFNYTPPTGYHPGLYDY